jgi:hypothetical protein
MFLARRKGDESVYAGKCTMGSTTISSKTCKPDSSRWSGKRSVLPIGASSGSSPYRWLRSSTGRSPQMGRSAIRCLRACGRTSNEQARGRKKV